MRSAYIDSLKLALSDSYDIPDSSYVKLSGILSNLGFSESAYNSGLLQLIQVILKNNLRFPFSLGLLKSFWEHDGVVFNFVSIMASLVKDGVIKLRKVKWESIKANPDDYMADNTEYGEDGKVIVYVYSTEKFAQLISEFRSILCNNSLNEGVTSKGISKKFYNSLSRAGVLLKDMDIKIQEESYVEDEALGTAIWNLEILNTSKYTCKNNVVLRLAKKYIGKVSCIREVDAYIDDDTELFLSITIGIKDKVNSDLPNAVYDFVRDLEVNYA